MSEYSISCVLIIPAELQAQANMLGQLLGFEDNTYSVPLASISNVGVISHYAAHSWVRPDFLQLLDAGQRGVLPPELEAAGFKSEQLVSLLSKLIVSARNYGSTISHFNEVFAAHNLILFGTI